MNCSQHLLLHQTPQALIFISSDAPRRCSPGADREWKSPYALRGGAMRVRGTPCGGHDSNHPGGHQTHGLCFLHYSKRRPLSRSAVSYFCLTPEKLGANQYGLLEGWELWSDRGSLGKLSEQPISAVIPATISKVACGAVIAAILGVTQLSQRRTEV